MPWRYTVYLMLIHFNNRSVPEAGKCYIPSSFISNSLKWISGSLIKATVVFFSVLWLWINTYARAEEMHLDRKQNLSCPGTLCPPLYSNVLTDRHMKSGSGPIEALALQAQTKPAVGSYGASYVSVSLSPYAASAPRFTPRCEQSSLSVTEITPAESLHFSVLVQRRNFTAHLEINRIQLVST